LAVLGQVRSKRMFGGYGLYSEDLFFGLLSQDTLFFKVDEAGRAECTEANIAFFDPRGDGKGLASYFEVSMDLRKNTKELKRWFQRALAEAARSAKSKGVKKDTLSSLRNIGPVSRPWLAAAGIRSRKDLEARGAVDVWLAIKSKEPRASLNLLYALEGARTDRSWSSLSPAERASLKERAGLGA